jgi:hypothetical protein
MALLIIYIILDRRNTQNKQITQLQLQSSQNMGLN